MAEKRRLNLEFEKKIKEMEETLDKINRTKDELSSNETQTHRSKYEEEMKREIKKLNKYKESLKGFSFTNDQKSKNLLDEYKKKIDKAIESCKEMKSKDAKELSPTKNKPVNDEEANKVKEELINNIKTLNEQCQTYKSEQEALSSKKGKFKQSTRHSQLIKWIDNHNFHINKLQTTLSKFESEEIKLNSFINLNENIKNYMATHEEIETTNTQDEFYTDFFVDEAQVENTTSVDTPKSPKTSSANANKESLEEILASLSISKDESTSKSSQAIASTDTQAGNKDPKSTEAPPVETSNEKSLQTLSSSPPSPPQQPTTSSNNNNPLGSSVGQTTSPSTHNNPPIKTQEEIASSSKKVDSQQPASNLNSVTDSKARGDQDGHQDKPNMKKITQDANWYNDQLLLSYQNYPTIYDGDRLNRHIPKFPWKSPHTAFPTTLIENSNTPQIYQLFNTDTLFFIFYYQLGTYQQYLAAKELKRRNWRFHKKSLIWFQRHEEPRVTTETSEQGDYIFFDYKNEWNFKLEIDYIFEYAYLEDELVD